MDSRLRNNDILRELSLSQCQSNITNSSIEASLECIGGSIEGVHLVYRCSSEIRGLILVKDYLNMMSLFVWPDSQRKGIATMLVDKSLEICRAKSPKHMIALNSSTFASKFYECYGFKKMGGRVTFLAAAYPMCTICKLPNKQYSTQAEFEDKRGTQKNATVRL